MTVEDIDNSSPDQVYVNCIWQEGSDIKRATLDNRVLKKPSAPGGPVGV